MVIVDVTKPTPGAKDDEVGVAELPTDTLARPDGSDIRVANAAGKWVPMQLLSVGPGSVARVAFAAALGRNVY
ncbi:MAG: hypothetical protein PHU85_17470, partial [Phycisphaerae bacterium]|nr:hypothetical protein [Phycisphaerae bacterium]